MQERRNSIAYALELRLSCTNLSNWWVESLPRRLSYTKLQLIPEWRDTQNLAGGILIRRGRSWVQIHQSPHKSRVPENGIWGMDKLLYPTKYCGL